MSLLFNSFSQNENQIGLPENAKSRIGIGNVNNIVYSPDGSTLAVATTIGIWLYDTNTYKPLSLLTGHTDSVRTVKYSADGKTLASGSSDNTIRLWDPHSGQNVRVLKGHQTAIRDIAFSRDGLTLASIGSNDKSVRLWNVKTGKLKAILKGCSTDILSLAFSPDGETIAAGEINGTVTLLSTKTKKLITTLVGHRLAPSDITEPGSVLSLAFSPDGETLASGSRDTTIRLWNTKTAHHKVTLTGHNGRVTTIVFSSDGNIIASGASYTHWSSDSTIRLWDATTGRHRSTIQTLTLTYKLAFSPDNETLVSISGGKDIHIWNTKTGKLKADLTAQRKSNYPKSVFSDSKRKIYVNDDGTYTLLDVKTGKQKPILKDFHSPIRHPEYPPKSLGFSPDGKTIAIQDGNSVWLWDVETDTHKATLSGHKKHIASIKFSPDGQFLSTAERESIRLWNVQTGEQIATYTRDRGYRSFVHAFSPDSKLLATPAKELKMVQLWNTDTGHPQFLLMGHPWEVSSVLFSPDGNTIVSYSSDRALLWDAKTGKLKAILLSQKDSFLSLMFSPDGNTLVGTAKPWDDKKSDNRIWIWDTETSQQKFILKDHKGRVTRILFASDGKTLVSGSVDKTIRFWDVKTGELINTFKGYDPNSPIVFSPDGNILASGGENAKVFLWALNTGSLETTFTAYNPVRRISFEENGKTLITSGTDGTTLLWDLKEKSK